MYLLDSDHFSDKNDKKMFPRAIKRILKDKTSNYIIIVVSKDDSSELVEEAREWGQLQYADSYVSVQYIEHLAYKKTINNKNFEVLLEIKNL